MASQWNPQWWSNPVKAGELKKRGKQAHNKAEGKKKKKKKKKKEKSFVFASFAVCLVMFVGFWCLVVHVDYDFVVPGFLTENPEKKGAMNSWKARWFVLQSDKLFYFKSKTVGKVFFFFFFFFFSSFFVIGHKARRSDHAEGLFHCSDQKGESSVCVRGGGLAQRENVFHVCQLER
jgi:hypothetical protein